MTIDINELREAIQTFGSQAINEGDLTELLARLELTESREAVYRKAFEISENTVRDLTEKVIPNIRDQLETAEKERDALRAKIAAMERQEPVASVWRCDNGHIHGSCERTLPMGTKLYALPGAPEQEPSREWWDNLIADISAIDCVHRGYPSYTHDAYWLRERVMQMFEHRRDAIPDAQPTPSIPEGWLRAIDEALVVAHIGVANESDTYEQAKVKLDSLIGFHVDVASDPAVNGGYKLMPIEPTHETLMDIVGAVAAPLSFREVRTIYDTVLAAPEAKP